MYARINPLAGCLSFSASVSSTAFTTSSLRSRDVQFARASSLNPIGTKAKPRRLPRLLFLALSHHYEDRLNRTLVLRFLEWEQPFCTRCTAQWVAMAAYVGTFPFHSLDLANSLWATVLFLLPLPALTDWVTQSWGYRESTTFIRILTGAALGTGYGLELQAIVELDLVKALIGVGVYCIYAAALLVLLKIRPFSSSALD